MDVVVVGLGVVVVLVSSSKVTVPTDLASASSLELVKNEIISSVYSGQFYLLSMSLTANFPSANCPLISSSSDT